MAAIVAATNAYLVSRQPAYLELPRAQMDRILSLGVIRRVDDLGEYGISYQDEMKPYLPLEREELFVVPYRYGDGGWFEDQSMHLMFPVALWNLSMHAGDWERIERLRQGLPYDGAAGGVFSG